MCLRIELSVFNMQLLVNNRTSTYASLQRSFKLDNVTVEPEKERFDLTIEINSAGSDSAASDKRYPCEAENTSLILTSGCRIRSRSTSIRISLTTSRYVARATSNNALTPISTAKTSSFLFDSATVCLPANKRSLPRTFAISISKNCTLSWENESTVESKIAFPLCLSKQFFNSKITSRVFLNCNRLFK